MSNGRTSPPAIGAASLFTAFAVLLLTMLALLSLSQARADRRLAEKVAEQTAAYYAADLEAQKMYAAIRRGKIPPGIWEENGVYGYSVPVSRHQTLFVEIQKTTSAVVRWQVVAHPEVPNEKLPVWEG